MIGHSVVKQFQPLDKFHVCASKNPNVSLGLPMCKWTWNQIDVLPLLGAPGRPLIFNRFFPSRTLECKGPVFAIKPAFS